MKIKNLFGIVLLFLYAISFISCESEESMMWDFYPIVLQISVQDAQGNDLLNPETEGSIANQGIKAIYRGEIYQKDESIDRTRAYQASFQGLQTSQSENDGLYYLTFGEFNGDETFRKEEIVIDWNDNTSDKISFSNRLTWATKNKPVIKREFYLNGKEIDRSGIFIIVK